MCWTLTVSMREDNIKHVPQKILQCLGKFVPKCIINWKMQNRDILIIKWLHEKLHGARTLKDELTTGTDSWGKWSQHKAWRSFKRLLKNTPRYMVWFLSHPVWIQELDSMILLGLFQLWIFNYSISKGCKIRIKKKGGWRGIN